MLHLEEQHAEKVDARHEAKEHERELTRQKTGKPHHLKKQGTLSRLSTKAAHLRHHETKAEKRARLRAETLARMRLGAHQHEALEAHHNINIRRWHDAFEFVIHHRIEAHVEWRVSFVHDVEKMRAHLTSLGAFYGVVSAKTKAAEALETELGDSETLPPPDGAVVDMPVDGLAKSSADSPTPSFDAPVITSTSAPDQRVEPSLLANIGKSMGYLFQGKNPFVDHDALAAAAAAEAEKNRRDAELAARVAKFEAEAALPSADERVSAALRAIEEEAARAEAERVAAEERAEAERVAAQAARISNTIMAAAEAEDRAVMAHAARISSTIRAAAEAEDRATAEKIAAEKAAAEAAAQAEEEKMAAEIAAVEAATRAEEERIAAEKAAVEAAKQAEVERIAQIGREAKARAEAEMAERAKKEALRISGLHETVASRVKEAVEARQAEEAQVAQEAALVAAEMEQVANAKELATSTLDIAVRNSARKPTSTTEVEQDSLTADDVAAANMPIRVSGNLDDDLAAARSLAKQYMSARQMKPGSGSVRV